MTKLRILVCGGRKYQNYAKVERVLNFFRNRDSEGIECIIHGGATGADSLASRYAKVNGIDEKPFPVTEEEWAKFKSAAGPIRNAKMITLGKPNLVIAFPGDKGTKNMIEQAERSRLLTISIP